MVHKLPTLALLILAYVAATWFPQPGLWARELRLPFAAASDEGGLLATWLSQVRSANVLLAVLLFSSGLSASLSAMRKSLRSEAQLLSLAGMTWGLPLLAALFAILGLKVSGAPDEITFAMWIVAAMPVANSSVGWANVMRANVPLSLTLLILSTSCSPLTSPLLIAVGSKAFGIELQAGSHLAFFAIWVLLPVVLGAWGAGRLNHQAAERIVPWARRISLITLLLLNYLNGAACLPSLIDEPWTLGWPLAAALGLVACVSVLFRFVPAARTDSELAITQSDSTVDGEIVEHSTPVADSKTLLLAVMMRNTGVALVYSTTALPGYDAIALTIIAYTLVQHLVVSLLVGWR